MALDVETFHDAWSSRYGTTPPHVCCLRDAHPERWLRIHSLPESRRYATDSAETQEILRRYNAAANDLLAGDAGFVLVGYGYGDVPRLPPDHPLAGVIGSGADALMRLPPFGFFEASLSVFGKVMSWSIGCLDGPLRRVADDQLELLCLNSATGAVFAPYDGGADLFYSTERGRDGARNRFAGWLSNHPLGL
jgi:hypothetical protein